MEETKTRCGNVLTRTSCGKGYEIEEWMSFIAKLEVTDVLKVAWHASIVKRNEKIT